MVLQRHSLWDKFWAMRTRMELALIVAGCSDRTRFTRDSIIRADKKWVKERSWCKGVKVVIQNGLVGCLIMVLVWRWMDRSNMREKILSQEG